MAMMDQTFVSASRIRLTRPLRHQPFGKSLLQTTASQCGLSLTLFAFLGLAIGCDKKTESIESYPSKPIKLIVPFGAGGGSDTFGRILQNAIQQNNLLPQPLVIVNLPGAGGTIGSLQAKQAKPDGYTLLLLHEGILTAQRAGQATYGPEAFTPIAGTGDATQVIAVGGESVYQDLNSLVDAATQSPDSVVFSANIGAPSHFAGLMLESEASGAAFRYTQTGGGAKRFAAIQGGHVDVSAFSISEYLQFRQSGMRALALLGSQRHPELPNLPTAAEQGFDVISQNMQFWWAPLGTPAERVAVVADSLDAAMQTPSVQQKLSEMKISPTVLRGQALEDEIQQRRSRLSAVKLSGVSPLPNFPAIAFGILVTFTIIAALRSYQRNQGGQSDKILKSTGTTSSSVGMQILCAVSVTTIGYVINLQNGWIPFVPATAVYVSLCCGVLIAPSMRARKRSLLKATIVIASVALMMSYAIHQLFTNVLVVDLPS